jgi:hypothetical protein
MLNGSHKVLMLVGSFVALIVMLSVHSSAPAGPTPSPTGTPTAKALATAACQQYLSAHWKAGKIDAMAMSPTYAVCVVSDINTGNMILFELESGNYLLIASGKPMFGSASDLTERGGVPASEASTLWASLSAQVPGL